MDPFFTQANTSKLFQQGSSIILTVAIVGLVIVLGEKAFGLNIRGAIDGFEDLMQKARAGDPQGDARPLVWLLIGALFAIVWLVRG